MTLSDVLQPGLKLVFCASVADEIMPHTGKHYPGPGPRFWSILFETGLTDRELSPDEYHLLPQYGIGLTYIARQLTDPAASLGLVTLKEREEFIAKMDQYAPQVIAFNGIRAAEAYFGTAIDYGLSICTRIAGAQVFVLPATSHAARHYWQPSYWYDLADYVRRLRRER